ncbi:MAG: hypothetical protein Q8N81_07480, partial [bacterium]|nr:hypothetical protein [bacterium]
HPAVARVFTTPPISLTRGLTIILRDPKPSADEMRGYYRSLESKGKVDVPWRSSVFEGADIPSHLARLKKGDAMDRVTYVRWLRRLKNASMDMEPDSIDTVMLWMDEDNGSVLLRIVTATFLMERYEHPDDFKKAWLKLTNEERNMAMRLWLSSASHWGYMRGAPNCYFELEAEYDEDVIEQRQRLKKEIEHDAAVQRAYERGKAERFGRAF